MSFKPAGAVATKIFEYLDCCFWFCLTSLSNIKHNWPACLLSNLGSINSKRTVVCESLNLLFLRCLKLHVQGWFELTKFQKLILGLDCINLLAQDQRFLPEQVHKPLTMLPPKKNEQKNASFTNQTHLFMEMMLTVLKQNHVPRTWVA